jgi:hypothetical protein
VANVSVDIPGFLGPGACSEFPNDNPGLHHGAIWRCTEMLGAATCEERLTVPWGVAEGVEIRSEVGGEVAVGVGVEVEVGVGVDEELNKVADDPTEAMTADVPDDPFATLLCLLEEVARASGGREDIALVLRAVLGETRMASASLSATAVEALVAGHCLEQAATGIKRTDLLTRRVLAWQGVLRGESEDFAACGSATLDEWAADVLARCMGAPALAPVLRRELRNRGVAAFGLVAQAA